MPKILHTADNHLRDRHLSRLSRGEDFTAAMELVVQVAKEHDVKAVVQSGDLLDSNRPSSKTIHDLAKLHYQLQEAGIWMFVVNGDHDQSKPHWAELLQFHTGHKGGMESNPGIYVLEGQLVTIPGTDLTLYGMPFIGKTKEKYLEIKDSLPDADILAWHTQIKEFAGFLGQDALTLAEIPLGKYKFIGLGDLHVRDYRQLADGTWIGYPGSTELCNSGEPLQKSVTLVEFDDHQVKGLEQVNIKTRAVRKYVFNTDEEVTAAVTELAAIRDQHPLVFGKFDRRLPHVVARICSVLEPDKAVIRVHAFPENIAPDQVSPTDDAEIGDFMPEFHTPGSDDYDLAMALLQPDAPLNDLIDNFITQRQSV
jgi:DNA repair exonuclease SbcCD nuclease subunit